MTEFNRQFNRIFVTGDIHGDILDLANRVARIPDVSKDDLLIILGDCGFSITIITVMSSKIIWCRILPQGFR